MTDGRTFNLAPPETQELYTAYCGVLAELDELAEAWLEHRAAGKDTKQLALAIGQATRESRRYERKLRKLGEME